ncbi:MAG: FUSC family membrane protein [Rhodoferax sp.]
MARAPQLLMRLPTYLLNGALVAAGVAMVHGTVGAAAGASAAGLALTGAVCTSLADAPVAMVRAWRQLLAGALAALAGTTLVILAQPGPVTLGLALALGGTLAMMVMSWGLRAGAVAFAPVLAMVFTLASPAGSVSPLRLLGWQAVGAALYGLWALATGWLMQPRWRTLAVASALQASAALLQARAEVWRTSAAAPAQPNADKPTTAAWSWVQQEAELADLLQAARDLVFVAPTAAHYQRLTAVLVHTIELRDVLLAVRLDLDLIGHDAPGRQTMAEMAEALSGLAHQLSQAALALRLGRPGPAPAPPGELNAPGSDVVWPEHDPRARLVPVLQLRLRALGRGVQHVHDALQGSPSPVALSADQLSRFVAPSDWPLSALKAQFSGHSPVLRHALRTGLAFGCAFALAQVLPWSAHPHWLVLSVAVVLRGNLAQTLARRNQRVGGTLLGCLLVVGLVRLPAVPWQALVFLLAVGTAHAFVVRRYWLAATAATIMALLQAHLMHPVGGLAVAERVADTVLGAGLAWMFSYVLPAWERRQLPRLVNQTRQALSDYALAVLGAAGPDQVAQRLARRRAYDSLGALSAAAQRSAAEPRSERLPTVQVLSLLDRGQRLMAHLSLVRLTLAAPWVVDAGPALTDSLAQSHRALTRLLANPAMTNTAADDGRAAGPIASAWSNGLDALPLTAPEQDGLPWLQRRLGVLQKDAQAVQQAAWALSRPNA